MRTVHYRDLGLIDYAEAWDLQTRLFEATIARKRANRDRPGSEQVPTEDHLLFCEHPHVYTLGKSGDQKHLLLNEEGLREQGVQFFPIDRGGDITYHGPGQIVGYPIFDLDHHFTDIHRFLRTLEEAVIGTLEAYAIKAGRIQGLTGVWLDADDPFKARKICAFGIRASRWVTMHG
ncbi:MAG: lipoyl(octanoyl) transferase LipB, partial [Flavobacteriales bacterium]|nr:lipoyl(octanoyl) transferase LipB [Flavobacteriales bacterium]